MAQYIMLAMTVDASGGVRIAPFGQRAMSALVIGIDDVGMADRAIDFGRDRGAGAGVFRISSRMTLGAGGPTMIGLFRLQCIDIK